MIITMYKKRMLDKLLERKLKGCGAVLMEGPKWCGKTTTCEQQARVRCTCQTHQ